MGFSASGLGQESMAELCAGFFGIARCLAKLSQLGPPARRSGLANPGPKSFCNQVRYSYFLLWSSVVGLGSVFWSSGVVGCGRIFGSRRSGLFYIGVNICAAIVGIVSVVA